MKSDLSMFQGAGSTLSAVDAAMPNDSFEYLLMKKCFMEGVPIVKLSGQGYPAVEGQTNRDVILALSEQFVPFYTEAGPDKDNVIQAHSCFFAWEGGMVQFWTPRPGLVAFQMFNGSSCDTSTQFLAVWNKLVGKKPQKAEAVERSFQRVFVVVRGSDGQLGLRTLGKVDAKFEPENYEAAHAEAFERIARGLVSQAPHGRLSVLEGPPGSGKSYFVRGLVERVKGAAFVLLPADMLAELAGPSLFPVLTETRGNLGLPIVLVIEDAENVLSPRMADNVALVSSLLNFSDGLFGELIDIRVIATTNARKADFDSALLRSGRLLEHVVMTAPSTEMLGRVLRRLVPGATGLADGCRSLADVYLQARSLGWAPPARVEEEAGEEDDGEDLDISGMHRMSAKRRRRSIGFGA